MKAYASLLFALILAGCSSSSKEYVCSPISHPEHRISLTLSEDKAFKGVVTGTDEYFRCLSHGNTTTYGKTKEDCAKDGAKGYSIITFDRIAKTLLYESASATSIDPLATYQEKSEFDYDECMRMATMAQKLPDRYIDQQLCWNKWSESRRKPPPADSYNVTLFNCK